MGRRSHLCFEDFVLRCYALKTIYVCALHFLKRCMIVDINFLFNLDMNTRCIVTRTKWRITQKYDQPNGNGFFHDTYHFENQLFYIYARHTYTYMYINTTTSSINEARKIINVPESHLRKGNEMERTEGMKDIKRLACSWDLSLERIREKRNEDMCLSSLLIFHPNCEDLERKDTDINPSCISTNSYKIKLVQAVADTIIVHHDSSREFWLIFLNKDIYF